MCSWNRCVALRTRPIPGFICSRGLVNDHMRPATRRFICSCGGFERRDQPDTPRFICSDSPFDRRRRVPRRHSRVGRVRSRHRRRIPPARRSDCSDLRQRGRPGRIRRWVVRHRRSHIGHAPAAWISISAARRTRDCDRIQRAMDGEIRSKCVRRLSHAPHSFK